MVRLGSFAGFGLIRPMSSEEFDWKPRFLAIEGNGILLWYLDEVSIKPEGAAALVGPPELTQTILIGGERVLRLAHAKDETGSLVQLEIAIPGQEVEIWQKVMDRHLKVSLEFETVGMVNNERHLEEEMAALMWDDNESEMTVQVFINNQEYPLMISPKDADLNTRAVEFVEENNLNGTLVPKIELELLRAQTMLFREREQHFRSHFNKAQRKLHHIVAAEAHASLAESCAASLSTTLKKMKEVVVPELQLKIDDLKSVASKWQSECEEAKALLEEERSEWELGNTLHLQDKEAMERDLKKAQYDAELYKKERDRYHKQVMSNTTSMDDDYSSSHYDRSSATNTGSYTSGPSKQPRDAGNGNDDAFFGDSGYGGGEQAPHPFSEEQLQADIVALRREKRELMMALKAAQNRAAVLQYELSDVYGQKSTQHRYGSKGLVPPEDNVDEIKIKYFKLRETCVLQKQQLGSADVKIQILEESMTKMSAKLERTELAKKALYDEHRFDKDQLQALRNSAAITNTSNLLKENRSLRGQLVKYRGEAVRLQLRVDELLHNTRMVLDEIRRDADGRVDTDALFDMVAYSKMDGFSDSHDGGGRSGTNGTNMQHGMETSPIRHHYSSAKSGTTGPFHSDEMKDSGMFAPPSPPSHYSPNGGIGGYNNPPGNNSSGVGNGNNIGTGSHRPKYSQDPPPHTANSHLSPLVEERIMKLTFHRSVSIYPDHIPMDSCIHSFISHMSLFSRRTT
jgi:hypothetical protein